MAERIEAGMLPFNTFPSRNSFLAWTQGILKADQRGKSVLPIGVGAQEFPTAEEFCEWAKRLTDDEWAKLSDVWIKFGPRSSKQA